MRNRTLLYFVLGLALAAVLIAASTNFAAGNKLNAQAWMRAQQRTPLLWMVDGCAIIILLGSCLMGAAVTSLQSQSVTQSDENSKQIATLTDTLEHLVLQNRKQAARLDALEETGDAWHEGFEEEATRLTEQAFLALSENIESNARQLEAINLALRYQRAEIKSVRTALKTGELPPGSEPPPSLDPVDGPLKPVLAAARKPQTQILPEDDEPTEIDDLPGPVEAVTPDVNGEAAGEQALIEPELITENQPGSTSEVSEAQVDAGTNEAQMESAAGADHTVNADSTVVETLEFDVSSKAADNFRRSKQEAKSIFRQKRP